jgi:hypothetical protein
MDAQLNCGRIGGCSGGLVPGLIFWKRSSIPQIAVQKNEIRQMCLSIETRKLASLRHQRKLPIKSEDASGGCRSSVQPFATTYVWRNPILFVWINHYFLRHAVRSSRNLPKSFLIFKTSTELIWCKTLVMSSARIGPSSISSNVWSGSNDFQFLFLKYWYTEKQK